MTQQEYHNNEIRQFHRKLAQIDRAPLTERQEARADVLDAMKAPEYIVRNLDWLLNGSYGYAEQFKAREIVANTRCNRAAQLTSMLGYLDHNCPANFTAQAYKKLAADERAALDKAIADFLYSNED